MTSYVEECRSLLKRLEKLNSLSDTPFRLTLEYYAELKALRSALSFYITTATADERSSKTSKFPLTYKGWKIQVRQGKDFKGTRGSVRNKRGYVATKKKLSMGYRELEFRPTYDTSPTLGTVKSLLDLEEQKSKRR